MMTETYTLLSVDSSRGYTCVFIMRLFMCYLRSKRGAHVLLAETSVLVDFLQLLVCLERVKS